MSTLTRPVARAHIRATDDEIVAELEVLDGTNLQPEHSPVSLYTEPRDINHALADALVCDGSSPTEQGWYLIYYRRANRQTLPRVAYWRPLEAEWRQPHTNLLYKRTNVCAWYGPLPQGTVICP